MKLRVNIGISLDGKSKNVQAYLPDTIKESSPEYHQAIRKFVAQHYPNYRIEGYATVDTDSACNTADIMRNVANPHRNEDHANNQLIEEVRLPEWALAAFQTDRPELFKALAPETLDDTDAILLLNAIRVVFETNQSLRKRLAAKEEQITTMQDMANRARICFKQGVRALDDPSMQLPKT